MQKQTTNEKTLNVKVVDISWHFKPDSVENDNTLSQRNGNQRLVWNRKEIFWEVNATFRIFCALHEETNSL